MITHSLESDYFYKYIWILSGLPSFDTIYGGGRTRGNLRGKSLSTVTMCPFLHRGQRSTSFPVRASYRFFQSIDLRLFSSQGFIPFFPVH